MVISDETRSKIEEAISKYPQKRGALLPAIHLVQADCGHVSKECAAELAEIFEILPIQVMEVVSFYNMFFDSPQAKHHVYVCTNLPCSLRGSRSLLSQLESHLGVTAPGATEDGRIFLGHEECLGACGYAPMMRVDDEYHEDLDVEKAKQILDSLGK
ncbi:MAG: NADH-quinone oxidoreductase subunit NuoE [Deltaproteobacteria bacterium]|jgi:NADH-quinone oxidoreductase subunit E|nr:NADH-quinone oxidoreductase subunit NuoE [Deltaproteobacteria bacterium]